MLIKNKDKLLKERVRSNQWKQPVLNHQENSNVRQVVRNYSSLGAKKNTFTNSLEGQCKTMEVTNSIWKIYGSSKKGRTAQ